MLSGIKKEQLEANCSSCQVIVEAAAYGIVAANEHKHCHYQHLVHTKASACLGKGLTVLQQQSSGAQVQALEAWLPTLGMRSSAMSPRATSRWSWTLYAHETDCA